MSPGSIAATVIIALLAIAISAGLCVSQIDSAQGIDSFCTKTVFL